MDSMDVNKAVAAVLVSGIAFFLCGLIASGVVHPVQLATPAIKVEVASSAEKAPPPEKEQPFGPLVAASDVAAGEKLAKRVCGACHTFDEGAKAGVGPNLYNVVGSPHGHMAGYSYSDALKSKTGPWTYDALNEWLTKPSAYAPGTKMSFPGFASEKQRAEVVAYLRTLSHSPVPLPAAAAAAPAAAAPAKAEPAKAPAPAQTGGSTSAPK